MDLSTLKPPRGARRNRRRIGRGEGSGRGCTAGKGNKGQRSRSGGTKAPGFEGGQMPLIRRLPKRGFHNRFGKCFAEVNVGRLEQFDAGAVIDVEMLKAIRIVSKVEDGLAILGGGELTKALTVKAARFTKGAAAKIEAAGGKAERV